MKALEFQCNLNFFEKKYIPKISELFAREHMYWSEFLRKVRYLLRRGRFFSTYAKFSENLTFPTPLIRTHRCAYQGERNVSFPKIFAYVRNE